MSNATERSFKYPLMGWPFPAVLVVLPLAATAWSMWLFATENSPEWLLLVGIALLCGVAAYFYYPVSITVAESAVGVRYLFGPTVWFSRTSLNYKLTFTQNVLKLRVDDTQRRSRLIGVFLFALPLLRGKHELLATLDKPMTSTADS